MEQLIEIIQNNIQYAPYIIFGSLLFAGLNLPVSEDAMLFISALLASQNPEYMVPLFLGVYGGAYFSDLICYWLGRKLGPKLWNIKFFANMVSKQKIDQISGFYHKYGIATLIFGRFIPFGVRNGLFLTAGLGKMKFSKFAISDLIACTISNLVYFTLYYNYGTSVIHYVKKGNIIIFSTVLILLIIYLVKKKLTSNKNTI